MTETKLEPIVSGAIFNPSNQHALQMDLFELQDCIDNRACSSTGCKTMEENTVLKNQKERKKGRKEGRKEGRKDGWKEVKRKKFYFNKEPIVNDNNLPEVNMLRFLATMQMLP